MPRVNHFEIHAENPERAMAFYEAVFGWTFQKWDGPWTYWMILTGPESEPGINGGLMARKGPAPVDMQPVNSYVCTVDVKSIDESLQAATDAGGTLALPKMEIPGVGWLAYCKDTEGNIFGMIEPKE